MAMAKFHGIPPNFDLTTPKFHGFAFKIYKQRF